MPDDSELEATVARLLELLGEDPSKGDLADTPKRVAEMYRELLAGRQIDPATLLSKSFDADHDEMVMVRSIRFHSLCEHHLLPFFGLAHVAYIPGKSGQIIGISKIARLVEVLSGRLQVQERLTKQIADQIENGLKPRGVLVVMEAEHLCMSIRGVQTPGSKVVTSALRGAFRRDPSTRAEAMQLINADRRWGMP